MNNNIPEYNVSELNKSIKEIIESNFNYIRIRGEISEIKEATKGQIYLSLKDDKSILSGVIWENKKRYIDFKPEVGIEVVATGTVTTWSRYKTTYQLDIDKLEIAGEGALLKLIEERKKRLQSKGFFNDNFKKKLPFLPTRIGVITSPTGSVIYDIINRIKDRFPMNIDIWPVPVQGSNSAEKIIEAIKGFNSHLNDEKPDVIIIARGGGSTEDLMTFNDENLIEEVFKSKIPLVSAIGHETDTTLIDFVSDLRASTPTAAAEIIVPIKKEIEQSINNLTEKLNNFLQNSYLLNLNQLNALSRFIKTPNKIIVSYKDKLSSKLNNLFKEINLIIKNNNLIFDNLKKNLKSPDIFINLRSNEIKKINKKLNKEIEKKFDYNKFEIQKLKQLLNSNSINSNLKKGYAIINKSKKIIKNSSDISDNDNIRIKFYDNSLDVNIKKIIKN